MNSCKIIEDLLPSYCDGLTSEESNAQIRAHVASCQSCQRLLKKMSAEPPREILDHREQFSRKLKEYERKHKVKILKWVLSCLVAALVLMLIWTNSEQLARWSTDIRMGDEGVLIAADIPADEYKVVNYYIYHTNDGFQVVTLAKHTVWNVWYFDNAQTAKDGEILSVAWFGRSNWSRFVDGADLEASTNFDINYLYIGNNATRLLQLDRSEIPGDVCVRINQTQSAYWIWVSSDNMDALNQFDVLEKMQLNKTN